MPTRLELHAELKELIDSTHVYYQPPESIKLVYPCIVYSQDSPANYYADNKAAYNLTKKYSITYIDSNPDSDIIDRMLEKFQLISAGSPYVSDNLNHYPFTLYY